MNFPQEQLKELYENLPKDLQRALFAPEITEKIKEICSNNNLNEEQNSEVAKYIGYVMLGVLPPEEFEETLRNELKISSETSRKISSEIFNSIFSTVNESLEALYARKINYPEEKQAAPVKKIIKKDTYRESTE